MNIPPEAKKRMEEFLQSEEELKKQRAEKKLAVDQETAKEYYDRLFMGQKVVAENNDENGDLELSFSNGVKIFAMGGDYGINNKEHDDDLIGSTVTKVEDNHGDLDIYFENGSTFTSQDFHIIE